MIEQEVVENNHSTIGINVSEQEVVENKHRTIDGGTRNLIGEEDQILNKQVAWVRWILAYERIMSLEELQAEEEERRRKKEEMKLRQQ